MLSLFLFLLYSSASGSPLWSFCFLQLAVIHSLRPCSFASPDFSGYAIFNSIICDTLYVVFTECSHILLYYISVKCPLFFLNIPHNTKYLAYSLIFFLHICVLFNLILSILFYPTLSYFSILYRLFVILISKRRALTWNHWRIK